MNALEGETIELPFPSNKEGFTPLTVTLTQFHKEVVLDNKFEKMEFSEIEGEKTGIIKLRDLEAGDYVLTFKRFKIGIYIRIFKGVYWESE